MSTNARSEPSAARSVTDAKTLPVALSCVTRPSSARVAHEAHALEREREHAAAARDDRRSAAQALHARGSARRLGAVERVGHAEAPRPSPRGGRRASSGRGRAPWRRAAPAGAAASVAGNRATPRGRPGRRRATGPHVPARLQEGTGDRRRAALRVAQRGQSPGAAHAHERPPGQQRRDLAQGGRRRRTSSSPPRTSAGASPSSAPAGSTGSGVAGLRPALAGCEPERPPPGRSGERAAVDLRARRRAAHRRGRSRPAPAPPGATGRAPRPPPGARAAGRRRAARPSRRRAARPAPGCVATGRDASERVVVDPAVRVQRVRPQPRRQTGDDGLSRAERLREARVPRRCRRRSRSVARGPPSSTSARSRSAWRAAYASAMRAPSPAP